MLFALDDVLDRHGEYADLGDWLVLYNGLHPDLMLLRQDHRSNCAVMQLYTSPLLV